MPTMPPRHRPAHAPIRSELRRTYDEVRAVRHDWRKLYKDKRWYATRSRQLRDHPLCAMCLDDGVVTSATVCDHVERHGGDEVRFFAGPFQSLCKSHHDRDKQRAERQAATDASEGRPTPRPT